MYSGGLSGMKTRDLIEHLSWSIHSFSDIILHVKIPGCYFNNKMMFHSGCGVFSVLYVFQGLQKLAQS